MKYSKNRFAEICKYLIKKRLLLISIPTYKLSNHKNLQVP